MAYALYLQDTYRFQCDALVKEKGIDERGSFVLLNQTVFYPQGGGQPSDMGMLQKQDTTLHVGHVIQDGEGIKHYIEGQIDALVPGETVICFVNPERRLLNARYHTAAHLLGHCVEKICPKLKTIRGHSFPGEAFIECEGEGETIDADLLAHAMQSVIHINPSTRVFEMEPDAFESQFYRLSSPVLTHKAFRAIQIGDFLPVPCGGTHVAHVGEIGSFYLKKIKYKDKRIRFSYALESL